MYGKWLYKEISTEYGACKVEIYRKNYTGVSIEIGALAANSLSIALENLGSITDPIGKSVCSFSIIDTDQVEYDDFFTPDATALKVVVSTRVGSGAYVTRWSGYITPDFFAENLSYRTPISISARDNIGYLNDVDFDLTATTITVRELIQSAFRKIAEDYPMSLSFVTQKQTAEGILAIDATISTTLLKEMSWGEALETILHDLGLQMRWADNNTIAVLDLSQIPEYYATQGFNFVDASGYREIAPAWRQLAQEQSYGVRENFYEGQIDQEAKLEYVTTSQISTNILLYQPIALTQWRREGAIYLLNFFNGYNFDVDDDKAESIYITGVGSNATITDVLATKMVYSQRVTQVDKQMKFTFNLNDTLREPRATSYNRGEADSIFYLPYSQQSGATTAPIPRPYQLKFRFNVFLRAEDGSEYVMREEWVDANTVTTEQPFIEFKTKKLEVYNSGVNDAQGNPRFKYTSYDNEEEFSITIGSIPKAGTLEFIVYPYTFVDDEYASVRDDATFQRGAKISNITFAIKDTATGIESNTLVDAQHNVKNAVSYSFGEVPLKNGDFLLYAGGLFNPVSLTALKGYQRNADATNYNLLELVGRELIHFNKKNYNRLSGTIKNLNKEPLMFNRLFVREGKKYAPYNYSLNVISNEMNITSMQEVEPYETATFNTIDSQITTGGGTVSGGNNTILQYSEEAGNEKRLYELQTATEQEKSDAYVLVDKAGFPEARKVHISELGGFDVRELELYLEKNGYTALKTYWTFNEQDDTLRTTHNIVVDGGGAFGKGAESGDIPSASVSIKFEGGNIVYSPVDGIITLPAYPSGGGGVADSVAWSNVTGKPTTLGGYGITDAIELYVAPNYIGARFKSGENATGDKYLEWWNSAGWVHHKAGKYSVADGTSSQFLKADGSLDNTAYLPLSGGKIDSTSEEPITINSNQSQVRLLVQQFNTSKSTLGWHSNFGTWMYDHTTGKSLGIRDNDGTPFYYDTTFRTLIHSGNIGNQSVNYASSAGNADTLDGYHADIMVKSYIDSTDNFTSFTDRAFFKTAWISGQGDFNSLIIPTWTGNNTGNYYITELRFYLNSWNPSIRYTHNDFTTDWKTLALISDNVASATKLQTARTIWGQSFDGSADIKSGIDIIGYKANGSVVKVADLGNDGLVVGVTETRDAWGMCFWTEGSGRGMIQQQAFTSAATTYPICLQPFGGNVLIGTTSDNGAKLQVDGDVKLKHIYISNSNDIYSDNGLWIQPYGGGEVNINALGTKTVINPGAGNVLIGKTSDKGYKLDVNGTTCIRSGNYATLIEAAAGVNGSGIAFWNGSDWQNGTINASTLYLNNDTSGNVLIGSIRDYGYKVQAEGGICAYSYNGDEGTLGTRIAGASFFGPYDYGLQLWVRGTGHTHIQSGRADNNAIAYNINLQPLGGNVLIGTIADNGAKLQVDGRSYIGNSNVWNHIIRSGNSSQSAEVYTLKVIQGTDCGSGLYDTMIITSNDVATLRLSESDGTQMGICAGDGHGTFTSTHDFRFFTGVATNQPVYSGGGGGFKVGINYEGAALYVSGNLTVTGGGAFGSDIRYKNIIAYQQLDLETIVNAPLFSFRWTDREDKVEHLGTSAQYWLDTQFKDAVNTANKDFFHLDYGALAVGIGISVAREVKGVKTEVQLLRERVNQLEQELAQYRRA